MSSEFQIYRRISKYTLHSFLTHCFGVFQITENNQVNFRNKSRLQWKCCIHRAQHKTFQQEQHVIFELKLKPRRSRYARVSRPD